MTYWPLMQAGRKETIFEEHCQTETPGFLPRRAGAPWDVKRQVTGYQLTSSYEPPGSLTHSLLREQVPRCQLTACAGLIKSASLCAESSGSQSLSLLLLSNQAAFLYPCEFSAELVMVLSYAPHLVDWPLSSQSSRRTPPGTISLTFLPSPRAYPDRLKSKTWSPKFVVSG